MSDNEHEVVNTDTSFASRKFIMVIIGLGVVFAGAILAAKMLGFAPSYETMVGGVIGLVALYVTGNVSEKFFGGKINAFVKTEALKLQAPAPAAEEVKPEDKPEVAP